MFPILRVKKDQTIFLMYYDIMWIIIEYLRTPGRVSSSFDVLDSVITFMTSRQLRPQFTAMVRLHSSFPAPLECRSYYWMFPCRAHLKGKMNCGSSRWCLPANRTRRTLDIHSTWNHHGSESRFCFQDSGDSKITRTLLACRGSYSSARQEGILRGFVYQGGIGERFLHDQGHQHLRRGNLGSPSPSPSSRSFSETIVLESQNFIKCDGTFYKRRHFCAQGSFRGA